MTWGKAHALILGLTEEGIRGMPAGDHIDGLVAKCLDLRVRKPPHRPAYSTDAAAALSLLSWLSDEMGSSVCLCRDGWAVDFTGDESGIVMEPDIQALPLAICRAGLLELWLTYGEWRQADLAGMRRSLSSGVA